MDKIGVDHGQSHTIYKKDFFEFKIKIYLPIIKVKQKKYVKICFFINGSLTINSIKKIVVESILIIYANKNI